MKSVRDSLQVEGIDQDLENCLWNNILNDCINKLNHDKKSTLFKFMWETFFKRKTDEIPSYATGEVSPLFFLEYLRDWFINAEWYEKYDLIEFLTGICDYHKLDFSKRVNFNLKSELAGYTIINQQITPITSDIEVQAIEEAINNTSRYKSVETHLKQSLELLSNREKPDFRNSIKESISAVEAYCCILVDDPKATLGKALTKIEKTHKVHNAMKSAFSNLYGYTSDSGGIRHSLLENEILVTFEDAKFMLISCSAFINYLKVKEE